MTDQTQYAQIGPKVAQLPQPEPDYTLRSLLNRLADKGIFPTIGEIPDLLEAERERLRLAVAA